MKFRYYYLFGFYTLFFLFYPGDSPYIKLFSYNRDIFKRQDYYSHIKIAPIPVTKTSASPQITAEGVYIVDRESFTPLFTKNKDQKFFPASTTKIITALVAFSLYKPDDVVIVRRVVNEGQVMGLVQDEKITVENLLYGILVHSGNDAAYALADHYGYDDFVNKMNTKAQHLGMQNSHFRNPAGLDDPHQKSTPFDLALASRELLKNKLLRKIVATKEITISDTDFKVFHRLQNVNQLLGEIQGIGGLKTGYTKNAGENLVSMYRNNGHDYIITIVKSQDRFTDTRNIVKWIDDNVTYLTI